MFSIDKGGNDWTLTGPRPVRTFQPPRSLVFDPRLLATAGCDHLSYSEHPVCECGEVVCLGFLSDNQQMRAKRHLAEWHGCALVQRKAA